MADGFAAADCALFGHADISMVLAAATPRSFSDDSSEMIEMSEMSKVLVVQQLPHRPFFLPLLKRFQEVNALKIGITGLEDWAELSMPRLAGGAFLEAAPA